MAEFDLWVPDPIHDGELVRRVYARSWPQTCREDFTPDEIITRLGARDLAWWQRKIVASPVRIAGGPALGGFGFALAAPEGESWDFGYLFLEPEAFGTGLADALYAPVIEQLREVTAVVGGWVLPGNTRSQQFLTRHGWENLGLLPPPWPSPTEFYRYELEL